MARSLLIRVVITRFVISQLSDSLTRMPMFMSQKSKSMRAHRLQQLVAGPADMGGGILMRLNDTVPYELYDCVSRAAVV